MGEELSKRELDELVAHFGQTASGGTILMTKKYVEADGTPRRRAMIDYGIAGTKKFDASERDLAVAAGKVKPSLETLEIGQLQSIASSMGVSIDGRPNKVKLVVAIRRKLEAEAKATVEREMAVPAEEPVIVAETRDPPLMGAQPAPRAEPPSPAKPAPARRRATKRRK